MIKAVIFDVGGVLHKTRMQFVFRDIRKTLHISKAKFSKASKIIGPAIEKGEITEREYFNKLITFTKTQSKLPTKSLFLREYVKRYVPNKKVLKFVDKIKKKNYKLAILSNTISSHTKFKMNKGIYKNFDLKIFSFQVGLMKPDPKIYKLTLKRLKLRPDETIFIDDKKDNVVVANKLGIKGILFKSENKLYKDLHKLKVL